jgi:hypothetical protein
MKLSSLRFLSIGALVAMLFIGCAHTTGKGSDGSPSALAADLVPYVGTWRDLETNALTQVVNRNGQLGVETIIDQDGELFKITKEAMVDGHFMWSYHVPSTGFDVTIQTIAVHGDTLKTTWKNAQASGEQDFERVVAQPGGKVAPE